MKVSELREKIISFLLKDSEMQAFIQEGYDVGLRFIDRRLGSTYFGLNDKKSIAEIWLMQMTELYWRAYRSGNLMAGYMNEDVIYFDKDKNLVFKYGDLATWHGKFSRFCANTNKFITVELIIDAINQNLKEIESSNCEVIE